jgi:hypothetical protein
MKRGKAHKKAKKSSGAVKTGLTVGVSLMVASLLPVDLARAQSIPSCFQTLSYGSIVACPGGGTVTVEPTGARSSTGCVVVMGNASPGTCFIQGSLFPVRPMDVSITAANYPLSNGTDQMSIDNFNLNAPGNGANITVSAFFTAVNIGARLTVAGGQAAGTYSGTATLNVNFQ